MPERVVALASVPPEKVSEGRWNVLVPGLYSVPPELSVTVVGLYVPTKELSPPFSVT